MKKQIVRPTSMTTVKINEKIALLLVVRCRNETTPKIEIKEQVNKIQEIKLLLAQSPTMSPKFDGTSSYASN